MLRVVATSVTGERHSLSSPVSAVLSRDLNTPADSFTAEFPFALQDEFSFVNVYSDAEEIFSGVVDEQIITLDEGVKTKFVCRSKAALLLDNEAKPRSFTDASAKLIYECYAKAPGFELAVDKDATLKGSFTVKKGVSCWQAIEEFSKSVWGSAPYVFGNTLYMKGIDIQKHLTFSDCGKGIAFTSFEYNRLRCKLISCVKVKLESGGDYTAVVNYNDAQNRGIVRERYLNASELSSKTLADADRLVDSSISSSEKISLSVPFCMTDVLACSAKVISKEAGELEEFYVTGVRYSFTENREFTRLTLKRKETGLCG